MLPNKIWKCIGILNSLMYSKPGRNGKVLDIACGTGKTMSILSGLKDLELFCCDISEMLLAKAAEKHNIPMKNIHVCDATQLPYSEKEFEYEFSIGSIEYFTEEGIIKFLSECRRTVKRISFHQQPVLRRDTNEDWITTT